MRNALLLVSVLLVLPLPLFVQAEDVRDVDDIDISGNTELPQNMIIVPWKQVIAGDGDGLPENSLTDEPFDRIDEAYLQREIEFYNVQKQYLGE